MNLFHQNKLTNFSYFAEDDEEDEDDDDDYEVVCENIYFLIRN